MGNKMNRIIEYPEIRISLERMKHTISTALFDYNEELSEKIDSEIQKAIEEYNFEEVIMQEVHKVITEAIEQFFRYGQGRTEITQAIYEIIQEKFNK